MKTASFKQYVKAAFEVLFPKRCLLCGTTLSESEQHVCISCLTTLPRTRLDAISDNVVARLFFDIKGATHGMAFLTYRHNNAAFKLIHHLKYTGRPSVGEFLGRMMAHDINETPFFENIDAIVPVPLAKEKQRKRGFNQSEAIAKGISEVTGIPVRNDLVKRTINNPTQTHLNAHQRRDNVEGIFTLCEEHFNRFCSDLSHPPHLLLVDDVITTGATMHTLAETMSKGHDVSLSFIATALAGQHLNVFQKGAE